ncbi:universal stress protein [Actinoplanes sp. GCM10030250]|uniref:universal stress protein n=1 Tax=Actinoplanes sp. GCM10030250 TaxID=3273376 RepID=UPI0036174A08
MFTTIAWATDGSPSSLGALPPVKALAHAVGAEVVIIHVQEVTISRGGFLAEDNRVVSRALRHAVRQLQDDGLHATVLGSESIARDVPQRILELAESVHASVLVVGNRGYGAFVNLLLGSVAARLLQTARIPVVMVPLRSDAETATADAEDRAGREIHSLLPT